MSNDKIIDKIRSTVCCGDEFEAVYIKIERLKAITECADTYADNANSALDEKSQRKQRLCILTALRVIGEIIDDVESGLDKSIQRIIYLTSQKA